MSMIKGHTKVVVSHHGKLFYEYGGISCWKILITTADLECVKRQEMEDWADPEKVGFFAENGHPTTYYQIA